ncbi:MAG: exodeoxyribonuclease VII small subunit [Janthinobacterium lividum]
MAKQQNPDVDISNDASAGAPPNFEAAMAELEQLVASMEAGELPLEASVLAYRRGAELVRYCTGSLDRVEQQVKVLEGEMLKPLASSVVAEADE